MDRKLLSGFRQLLIDIKMKELHLHGRRYTWTSGPKPNSNQNRSRGDFPGLGDAIPPLILACTQLQKKYKGVKGF
jgi:hypothetical protein